MEYMEYNTLKNEETLERRRTNNDNKKEEVKQTNGLTIKLNIAYSNP